VGRRRLVVLLSAITMLLIGAGVVAALVTATQSDGGRAWIRTQLVRLVARGVKGRLFVGNLSGSFITDFAVDSVAIIGPDDSVFIATGPVHVTYDPRDLIDGRIILRSVDLQHPFFVIRKENDNVWNYNKVFPPGPSEPSGPPPSRSAFGAIVQFRNVRIRGLQFQLTLPWSPDDSLKGARRDSAIVKNLAAADQEIRVVTVKGKRGYQRTTRWTEGNFTFNRIRFRDPLRPGRQFEIARFDVNEQSPPFNIRNMRGLVLWHGDSITLDIPHLELPGSVAHATGRLDWANNKPVKFDLRILSDSVSLRDVAWITSVIPKSGGGSVDLRISSDKDPHLLDYVIAKMDLRTNASRLRGAMTFAVGGPVLILRDMDVELLPLDFQLIDAMNGGPFAQPWNGTFTGRVRARGGPVNHFVVDELRVTYADRNVDGANSAFVGSGEMDILRPAEAAFHGFHLALTKFDLRTPQALDKSFPHLNGTISGDAILDSVWTDVRFREADITHHDGDDDEKTPPSRFKGEGRLTSGGVNLGFDVSVAALPLSLNTLALSWPGLPVRGAYTGPIRLQGDITDFSATADLVGDGGRLQIDGQFDASAPGYRAFARGSVGNLDLHAVMARAGAPVTNLNGRFVTSLEFDSLPNTLGDAQLSIDRSVVDGVRIYSGQANLHFAGGAMQVDTLRIESTSFGLTAHGGLGLTSTRIDSLSFHVDVDSLGGLRRYLVKARAPRDSAAPPDTAAAAAAALADSLGGSFSANGTISGTLSSFGVRATGNGTQLRRGDVTARQLSVGATVRALPDSAVGAVSFSIDTLHIGSLAYSRVSGRDSLMTRGRQRVTVSAKSAVDSARATADLRFHGDSTDIGVDSLAIATVADTWFLRRRAQVEVVKGSVSIDSIALSGKTGGSFALSGGFAADSAISLAIRTDSVPLADIGEMLQVQAPFEGTATLRADLTGTRESPLLKFDGTLRHGVLLGLRLDELRANGDYANRRLSASLEYLRLGLPALHGTAKLPVNLAFSAAGSRLIEEPIVASIHTDSGGMSVIASLSKSVTKANGSLALDADFSGTWKHPLINGALVIHDGELSLEQLGAVRLTALEANVVFHGDSITGNVSAHSGKTKPATGELSGFVGIRDIRQPTYNLKLTAQNFNVIDKARFATLDLTGNVYLTGRSDDAVLTGSLTVDRGIIAIPELFSKHVISLDDPEFYKVVDTSAFEDRHLLPAPPLGIISNLSVSDLKVQMGRDVWLRSSEANINLGGQVTIQKRVSTRDQVGGRVQLALDGALQTVRGTYRLSLAPGVSRTFTVENGNVRFFGDQDLNGALDINALYTVRQSSSQGARPDVRVRVTLGGTILSPTVKLTSPDSQRVSTADLVSYLATGQPSNQIGGPTGDYTSTAVNVFLNSGFQINTSLCDETGFSTGVYDASQSRSASGSVLSGARINCGRQLGEKAFLRLDYGLCRVGQLVGGNNGTSDPLTFADAIGLKVDYQLTTVLTLSAGIEPPTSAVLCTSDASARGFAPTPRQFGIDLVRLWRF
jgi:translocation and assembly module TamB